MHTENTEMGEHVKKNSDLPNLEPVSGLTFCLTL